MSFTFNPSNHIPKPIDPSISSTNNPPNKDSKSDSNKSKLDIQNSNPEPAPCGLFVKCYICGIEVPKGEEVCLYDLILCKKCS